MKPTNSDMCCSSTLFLYASTSSRHWGGTFGLSGSGRTSLSCLGQCIARMFSIAGPRTGGLSDGSTLPGAASMSGVVHRSSGRSTAALNAGSMPCASPFSASSGLNQAYRCSVLLLVTLSVGPQIMLCFVPESRVMSCYVIQSMCFCNILSSCHVMLSYAWF